MDLEQAFTSPFAGEDWWKKVGIGSGLMLLASLIPGVGFLLNIVVQGYLLQLLRQVLWTGEGRPLPAWNDLTRIVLDGLILFAIGLIYAIPLLLIGGCIFVASIRTLMAGFSAGASSTGGPHFTPLLSMGLLIPIGLFLLLALVVGLMTPFIYGRYAQERRFGAAFELGTIFRMLGANFAGALGIAVLSVVFAAFSTGAILAVTMSSAMASFTHAMQTTSSGGVAPSPFAGMPAMGITGLGYLAYIPVAIFGFYFQSVIFNLYGQLYRRAAGITTTTPPVTSYPPAYGQPPYGQPPYGQPPYGTPPYGTPYPPSGSYTPPQYPYTPPSGAPYGTPPYGMPYTPPPGYGEPFAPPNSGEQPAPPDVPPPADDKPR